jgi:hypothetical protein
MKNSKKCIVALTYLTVLSACSSNKHVATNHTQSTAKKVQIAEFEHDWVRYQVYLLTNEKINRKSNAVKLSIMVINTKNNSSPLRRLCSDINQYNVYNEYLLNGAKNEIFIMKADRIYYPIYYSFENNYNAFPFETINIGYSLPSPSKRQNDSTTLVFIDRVFAQDTIYFNLTKNIK